MKDGRVWRIGSADDVAWIDSSTVVGRTIRSAVPAVFAAYAALVDPRWDDDGRAEGRGPFAVALLEHLAAQSPRAWWWLGFLDTGSDDVVFPEAPKVSMYANWKYVFVLAGPEQAASWRRDLDGPLLPDVIFPEDRSWLVSTLWDDSWTCVGGSVELVGDLQGDQRVVTLAITVDQDMTPPGHAMR